MVGRLHDDKKLIDAITNAFHNDCKYGLLSFGHFSSIKTRTLFLTCLPAGIKLWTEKTNNKKHTKKQNKNKTTTTTKKINKQTNLKVM